MSVETEAKNYYEAPKLSPGKRRSKSGSQFANMN